MKSKMPPKGGGSNSGDPEKDLSRDQLAKIGAIAIAFNYTEVSLERILVRSLNVNGTLWLDTAKRLGSIDNKIELCKLSTNYAERTIVMHYKMDKLTFKTYFQETLGILSIIKQYRDLVLHSIIYNASPSIGLKFGFKGEIGREHVILSFDALSRYYSELTILRKELDEWEQFWSLIQKSLADPIYQPKLPPEQKALACLSRCLAHQKERHLLGPYPRFPD